MPHAEEAIYRGARDLLQARDFRVDLPRLEEAICGHGLAGTSATYWYGLPDHMLSASRSISLVEQLQEIGLRCIAGIPSIVVRLETLPRQNFNGVILHAYIAQP